MVLFRTFRLVTVLVAALKVVRELESLLRPPCPTTRATGDPANPDLPRLLSRRDPLSSVVALALEARMAVRQGLQIPRRRGPLVVNSSQVRHLSHPAGLAACAVVVRWALPEILPALLKKATGGGLLLLAKAPLVCDLVELS